MKKQVLTVFILLAALFCMGQSGSITVTSLNQRADGSGMVDVYFNLDGTGSAYNINIEASFDAGSSYTPIHLTNKMGYDTFD